MFRTLFERTKTVLLRECEEAIANVPKSLERLLRSSDLVGFALREWHFTCRHGNQAGGSRPRRNPPDQFELRFLKRAVSNAPWGGVHARGDTERPILLHQHSVTNTIRSTCSTAETSRPMQRWALLALLRFASFEAYVRSSAAVWALATWFACVSACVTALSTTSGSAHFVSPSPQAVSEPARSSGERKRKARIYVTLAMVAAEQSRPEMAPAEHV